MTRFSSQQRLNVFGGRDQFRRELGMELLERRELLAADVLAATSQSLHFSTDGQSMWGPGAEATLAAPFEFEAADISIDDSFGQIEPEVIDNQSAVDAYNLALDACSFLVDQQTCMDFGFDLPGIGPAPTPATTDEPNEPAHGAWEICDDLDFADLGVCGPEPDKTVSVYTSKYIGWAANLEACKLTGRTQTQCIDGIFYAPLGNPPPEEFLLNDGAIVDVDAGLKIGFEGALEVNAGRVGVDYVTEATVEILGDSFLPGDLLTIVTSESMGVPQMDTEFATIAFNIAGNLEANATVSVDAVSQGVPVVSETFIDFDGGVSQEIFTAEVATDQLALSAFGLEPLELSPDILPEGIFEFDVPVPNTPFSMGDFEIFFPDLGTSAPNSSGIVNGILTNTHLPVTPNGADPTAIDLTRLDIDLDALSTLAGLPLGASVSAGGPLGFNISADILDVDLRAFLGIGQTMTFQPELMVDLTFSQPADVEILPDVWQQRSSIQIPVGDTVNVRNPGGAFNVVPEYSLQNTFTNVTDVHISPAVVVGMLKFEVSGLLVDLLDLGVEFAAFDEAFPLGEPALINLSDTQFALQGFQSVSGESLSVPSAPGGDPLMVDEILINDGSQQRSNIETISVRFNQDNNIQNLIDSGQIANSVRLTNGIDLQLAASRFAYDASTFTMMVDLTVDGAGGSRSTLLSDGRYELRLDTGMIGVNGETNNSLVDDDGVSDGSRLHQFHRLQGDFDGNRTVSLADRAAFFAHYGSALGSSQYDFAFDLNGDGFINIIDYMSLVGLLNNAV